MPFGSYCSYYAAKTADDGMYTSYKCQLTFEQDIGCTLFVPNVVEATVYP